MALLATGTWAWLVHWRIGHHRAAIWKIMALPAGGAVLCWFLLMTLWLPLLNYARSYAPLVEKVTAITGESRCLQYAGLSKAQGTAFLFHGQFKLEAMQAPTASCPWLIIDEKNLPLMADKMERLGWVQHAKAQRPADKDEHILIYRASAPSQVPRLDPALQTRAPQD